MERRGFLRLLGSCFPLVLAFLTAAVLAAPAGSLAAPAGPALGTDRAASAAMVLPQWGLTVTAVQRTGSAVTTAPQSGLAVRVVPQSGLTVTGLQSGLAVTAAQRSGLAVMALQSGLAVTAAQQSCLAATASSQRGHAAAVHLQADQPAAFPVATVASPPAVIAAAPRALRDTGSRAPAAPRGPPHLSA